MLGNRKVQMKFLKRILHLPNSCPNVAVRGELVQLPIHLWWKESILKHWNRQCSPDIPMLLKEAAHTEIANAAPGRHNWVSRGIFLTMLDYHLTSLNYTVAVEM